MRENRCRRACAFLRDEHHRECCGILENGQLTEVRDAENLALLGDIPLQIRAVPCTKPLVRRDEREHAARTKQLHRPRIEVAVQVGGAVVHVGIARLQDGLDILDQFLPNVGRVCNHDVEAARTVCLAQRAAEVQTAPEIGKRDGRAEHLPKLYAPVERPDRDLLPSVRPLRDLRTFVFDAGVQRAFVARVCWIGVTDFHPLAVGDHIETEQVDIAHIARIGRRDTVALLDLEIEVRQRLRRLARILDRQRKP